MTATGRRRILAAAALALLAALATAQDEPSVAIPEEELGFAKGSVFEVPVPPPVSPESSDPGEEARLAPDYDGSPPRVPHAVADFLPITRDDNLCVDCHGITEADEGDPTPIPPSHYTDLRRAPDRVGESVAGARWVCLSCHVPLTGAEPPVGNRFAVAPTPRAGVPATDPP